MKTVWIYLENLPRFLHRMCRAHPVCIKLKMFRDPTMQNFRHLECIVNGHIKTTLEDGQFISIVSQGRPFGLT